MSYLFLFVLGIEPMALCIWVIFDKLKKWLKIEHYHFDDNSWSSTMRYYFMNMSLPFELYGLQGSFLEGLLNGATIVRALFSMLCIWATLVKLCSWVCRYMWWFCCCVHFTVLGHVPMDISVFIFIITCCSMVLCTILHSKYLLGEWVSEWLM